MSEKNRAVILSIITSSIGEIRYVPDDKDLSVKFRKTVYVYHDVTMKEVYDMYDSPSMGEYIVDNFLHGGKNFDII